jgi:uroporphyrin-III C-methyltransferase/precorrin-2 dehydrogenase/sirohydrochlorin ferrochelatase
MRAAEEVDRVYPVMLNVKGKKCLVVGGGGVALRKVQGLVEDGAHVTLVSPEVVDPLRTMAERGQLDWQQREYVASEAERYFVVFAATDDRKVNSEVFGDADRAGVWVNVADDPELCTFHLPARVRRGPLQLAIGSAGEAPFAVRRLRQLLERKLGTEWGEWVESAARFRNRVRSLEHSGPDQEARYDRFFKETVDAERLTARVPSAREEQQWLNAPVDHNRAAPVALSDGEGGCKETHSDRGFVSLVGAGPGCPGLLTMRGRQRLSEAEAVVYDRLAAAALPCDLDPEVELHPVGKIAGDHPIPQEEINALLVRLARAGKRVVRLKGGDPYVFGRGGEEAEVLEAEGILFEVVPGVTSGVAALAWAGIPATHRKESVRLTLLTAHEAIKGDGPQVRWDLLAQDQHATIVGYMGVTALPTVVDRLLEAGMNPQTPAAMVEQGTTSAQRTVVSTLAELPAVVEREGLRPPALFAIGTTVQHAERLDWHGRLPLAGQRLLLAASAVELGAHLEEAGAEVVMVPLPVTPAARAVIAALPLSGCVVSSRAEVDWLDDERGNSGWGPEVVSWCVGREAAERARVNGWQRVCELAERMECVELVASIAGTKAPAGGDE